MSVHACVAVNVCHFRRNWRLLRKLLLQLQLFNKCLPYAFALKLAIKRGMWKWGIKLSRIKILQKILNLGQTLKHEIFFKKIRQIKGRQIFTIFFRSGWFFLKNIRQIKGRQIFIFFPNPDDFFIAWTFFNKFVKLKDDKFLRFFPIRMTWGFCLRPLDPQFLNFAWESMQDTFQTRILES